MGRGTAMVGALALVVAACSGGASPNATSNLATPAPSASPAAVTPAATGTPPAVTQPPAASPMALSAAVSWDGRSCTYTGPTVVPRGAAVTFTLDNTPAALAGGLKGAGLLVMPVRDGTTWETITKSMGPPRRHVSDVPAWARIPGVGDDGTAEVRIMYAPVTAGETLPVMMTRSLYYVMCGTPENDLGYESALLKVLPPSTASASATPVAAASAVAISAAVTWDGKACTYVGPAVVARGAVLTISMTNTPAALQGSAGAALVVAPVVDGTTWERIVADSKAAKSASDEPSWLYLPDVGDKEMAILYPQEAGLGITVPMAMTRNLYTVFCVTPPQETDRPYPAALIKVLGA